MVGEYTFVRIDRQEALTRAIQQRLANVAPMDDGPDPNPPEPDHATERGSAKVIAINATESAA